MISWTRDFVVKKIIYIKYGELVLKGKNKIKFINCLYENVLRALNNFKSKKIIKFFDSIHIENILEEDFELILNLLTKIPGIALVIQAYEIERSLASLQDFLLQQLINEKTTFKVNTKRIDKTYEISSMDFSKNLGGFVLNNFLDYSVDIHSPNLKINIEIKKDNFVIYFKKFNGVGGFPVGINGKTLMLLSGGIDSPVASHLLLKKGMHVDFLTFISPPHTSEQVLKKVEDLISIITLDSKLENSKLYICNFTSIQHEIAHISNHSYQITIMRRYFFRIAQELAKKFNYNAIATGESLGQVASQTIESMTVIQDVLKDLIVLRPLLTYDKNDIIKLANYINTYNISILPFADSCSLFVPTNPITKPKIEIAKKLEAELELIDTIYNNVLNKHIEERKN